MKVKRKNIALLCALVIIFSTILTLLLLPLRSLEYAYAAEVFTPVDPSDSTALTADFERKKATLPARDNDNFYVMDNLTDTVKKIPHEFELDKETRIRDWIFSDDIEEFNNWGNFINTDGAFKNDFIKMIFEPGSELVKDGCYSTLLSHWGLYLSPHNKKEIVNQYTNCYLSNSVEGFNLSNYDLFMIRLNNSDLVNYIYLIYDVKICNITFSYLDDSGNIINDTKQYEAGKQIIAPTVPMLEGSKFVGWNKPIGKAVSDDVFIAQYQHTTYNVYYMNNGVVSKTVKFSKYDCLTGYKLADYNSEKDGKNGMYKFIGWTTTEGDKNSLITSETRINANTTVYSYFEFKEGQDVADKPSGGGEKLNIFEWIVRTWQNIGKWKIFDFEIGVVLQWIIAIALIPVAIFLLKYLILFIKLIIGWIKYFINWIRRR